MAVTLSTSQWMPLPDYYHHAHGSSESIPYYTHERHHQAPSWSASSEYAEMPQQRQAYSSLQEAPAQASPYQLAPHPTYHRQSSSPSSLVIEPDPLPPHSNPQSLSFTQSRAFSNSSPISPVRLGQEEAWSSTTGFAPYTITPEMAHDCSSTKGSPTVWRVSTGTTRGSIRFHNLMTGDVALTINGRETTLSQTGFLHKRWAFSPTTCPNTAEKWFWKKDKLTGGAVLEDAKRNARVLARISGDLLTFEKAGLSDESCDEIVISALAMVEAATRTAKGRVGDHSAGAVGEFSSSESRSGSSSLS